jgi:membrane associated rhomboid family serine protease
MIPLKDDNPSRSFPFVTIGLIISNIVVFMYQLSLGHHMNIFILKMGTIPYEISHFEDLRPKSPLPISFTLITYMFIHGGFLHLIGNMLYLWIFGDNVEDSMGHIRFLIFYIICGILAGLFQIFSNPNSIIPMIGASGAIAGVLGAYFILYPKAHILTLIFFFFFIRIIRIPAVILLGLWFFIQVVNSSYGGGVAWYAHIGGFVSGIFLVGFFIKRRKIFIL